MKINKNTKLAQKTLSTSVNGHLKALRIGQKRVRKSSHGPRGKSILQINLGHLVAKYKSAGTVKAYECVAAQLSRLAGLNNGHSWGWRYVASVLSRSIEPSKKFRRALDLRYQEIKPSHKQWHYFAWHHDVLSFYTSTARAEIIRTNLKPMGYRAVTYSRYMEIKHVATHTKHGGKA